MTRPAGATRWRGDVDWTKVRRVLVVKLRSIGDTVLATPTFDALRRFLPEARIDVLLEDWVAPVLDRFDAVDTVITVSRKDTNSRVRVARQLRRNKYDIAFNLHGGTTATFFVRASGAPVRVGYSDYSYSFLYTHLLESAAGYWQRPFTHSAEQQLALAGFVGVPVEDKPKSRLLPVSAFQREDLAVIHPVAAFDTKTWATENFARVAEHLASNGLKVIAVATKKEREVLERLSGLSRVPIEILDSLSLPEIADLASRARIFVGNDSGIAHIAAAVRTPLVVVFGSSNVNHWRPWTDAPNEVVFEKLPCQPCPGYVCGEFDAPKCILSVTVESVMDAINRVLNVSENRQP